MNENHARLCPSPEWAAHIQEEVLPSLTEPADLGDDMLEIGPGPGAATEWLRHRVKRLTALEVDEEAAGKLADRYAGSNVKVVNGNAAELDYPDGSFDSVGCFTMLHHVPTLALQNKILAEAFRVLRPGGVLISSDSLASNELHHFHAGDTYNPIDPGGLVGRLQTLGFDKITITVDGILKFVAFKPDAPDAPDAPDDQSEGGARGGHGALSARARSGPRHGQLQPGLRAGQGEPAGPGGHGPARGDPAQSRRARQRRL